MDPIWSIQTMIYYFLRIYKTFVNQFLPDPGFLKDSKEVRASIWWASVEAGYPAILGSLENPCFFEQLASAQL